MPSKLIIANWKMFGATKTLQKWCADLQKTRHTVVLCVQPLLIHDAVACAKISDAKLTIGGQDCHVEDEGAYTGFTSPKLLGAMGGTYVIVGHSERRSFESDALIHKKAVAAQRNHLIPVVCVGESLDIRRSGDPVAFVLSQIKTICTGLEGLYHIAYEPLWAIGTGMTPTLDDIAVMHTAIKDFINNENVKVLYGGSVKPDNAHAILSLPSVGGLLVGGASLQAEDFNRIIL
jgi:triosephosphate isomerase